MPPIRSTFYWSVSARTSLASTRRCAQALRERKIIVEAVATGGAVRTYNILLGENRAVGAALIAVETRAMSAESARLRCRNISASNDRDRYLATSGAATARNGRPSRRSMHSAPTSPRSAIARANRRPVKSACNGGPMR